MQMRNTVADKIFAYAEKIGRERISATDSDELKKRIADSFFVAYGARNSPPVKIAKSALLPSSSKHNAHLYFSGEDASAETASFINGTMTRYLDYNDTYLSKEDAHPSDNIPPIIAYAEAMCMKGKHIINALMVAYQVQCALCDAASLRDHGWDQVTYLSVSSAAGIAALIGLDREKFTHAINLSLSNNICLRQTRAGELSMWKGCTAGNATRNGLFAAVLAGKGLTGPSPIFEGEMGFFKQVSGKFTINLDRDRIIRTMIKGYPVEYRATSAVDAAIKLRQSIDASSIKKIVVETFSSALRIIIKDPQKLKPKTKETADHSMPYIIAYTLLYGSPTIDSYSKKYLSDRRLLGLIRKMSFIESVNYNNIYPSYLPVKITLYTRSKKLSSEVMVPKGHFRYPYSWDDLQSKGMAIIKNEDSVKSIINTVKSMDKRDASELLEVMKDVDS